MCLTNRPQQILRFHSRIRRTFPWSIGAGQTTLTASLSTGAFTDCLQNWKQFNRYSDILVFLGNLRTEERACNISISLIAITRLRPKEWVRCVDVCLVLSKNIKDANIRPGHTIDKIKIPTNLYNKLLLLNLQQSACKNKIYNRYNNIMRVHMKNRTQVHNK